jgi:hypothetical protein
MAQQGISEARPHLRINSMLQFGARISEERGSRMKGVLDSTHLRNRPSRAGTSRRGAFPPARRAGPGLLALRSEARTDLEANTLAGRSDDGPWHQPPFVLQARRQRPSPQARLATTGWSEQPRVKAKARAANAARVEIRTRMEMEARLQSQLGEHKFGSRAHEHEVD